MKIKLALAALVFLALVSVVCVCADDAVVITDLADYDEYVVFVELSAPADFYVDGELVLANSTAIPKNALALGRHKIEIHQGDAVIYSREHAVIQSYFGTSTFYDFEDYEGGSYTVDSKRVFVEGAAGFTGAVTVDEEHGKSFGILYRNSDTTAPWVRNDLPKAIPDAETDTLHYEIELYIPPHVKDYAVTMVNEGRNYINFVNFLGAANTAAPNRIRIYSDNQRHKDLDFETEEGWYKIETDITVPAGGGGTYSLAVSRKLPGETGFTELYREGGLQAPDTLVSLTGFRFTGPYADDSQDAFLALDHVSCSYKYGTPVVSAVCGAAAEELVSFDSKSLEIKLSLPLHTQELSPELLYIDGPLGRVLTDAIQLVDSQTVSISLGEKLLSNSEYNITFDESIKLPADGVLGRKLTHRFTTSKDTIEVLSAEFENGVLSATVENTAETPLKVHLVVSLWKDNALEAVRAFDIDLPAKTVTPVSQTVDFGDCDRIQAAFVENYQTPVVRYAERFRAD